MSHENEQLNNPQIIDYLKNLDNRITRIESMLDIEPYASSPGNSADAASQKSSDSSIADMNIGEYWFANLGILVLVIFFSFLLFKPYPDINQFLPTVLGFTVTGCLLFLSKLWKNSYSNISGYLFGSGLFLFYISAMRLFYFTPEPAFENKVIEGILLLAIPVVIISLSVKKQSVPLNSLGFALLAFTGLRIGEPVLLFILLTCCSAGFVIMYRYKNFDKLFYLLLGIIITYLTHLIWFLNTPLFGNDIKIVSEPGFHIFFLLVYMIIYAAGLLTKTPSVLEEEFDISISFTNVILGLGLFTIVCLLTLKEYIFIHMILFSVISLILAILYRVKTKSKHSTSLYVLASAITLSISLISYFGLPAAYTPLIWQSIIVIALAIWFESKSLVVSNFIIFLMILFAYLISAKSFGFTTVSIGFVGLVSARILNWQKDRLTLQTEFLRNTYLIIAFITIPFSLIEVLPIEYIGLSLIGLASLYYLMSGLLHNFKYRWMAHFTLLASVIYILIFSLSEIDTIFQIITLFALAITLISVSIFYTRMRLKSNTDKS